MGDAVHHELDAWQSYTIAPQLIFGRIAIRIFQPLPYLIRCLGFYSLPHCDIEGIEDFYPFCNFLITRIFYCQPLAPPVRESLQPCTLLRCQPADDVFSVICRAVVYNIWIFIIPCSECRRFFLFNMGKAACCYGIGNSILMPRIRAC